MNTIHDKLLNSIKMAANASTFKEAREWIDEARIILGTHKIVACTKCHSGKVYVSCDCHDPYNCLHRDGRNCRKCNGKGWTLEEVK